MTRGDGPRFAPPAPEPAPARARLPEPKPARPAPGGPGAGVRLAKRRTLKRRFYVLVRAARTAEERKETVIGIHTQTESSDDDDA